MTSLTRKHIKYERMDNYKESFPKLKTCLTLTLVLALLVGFGGFKIYYDALRIGLGCVLM